MPRGVYERKSAGGLAEVVSTPELDWVTLHRIWLQKPIRIGHDSMESILHKDSKMQIHGKPSADVMLLTPDKCVYMEFHKLGFKTVVSLGDWINVELA